MLIITPCKLATLRDRYSSSLKYLLHCQLAGAMSAFCGTGEYGNQSFHNPSLHPDIGALDTCKV